MRRIVGGHSGGVTSAWALGYAVGHFPKDEVVALFHDTRREHKDTYRFLHEIAGVLGIAVTEQSDGRTVEEVEDDEGAIANNRMAFCSRILKAEQRDKYFDRLRSEGVTSIANVVGFERHEEKRIQRAMGRAISGGYEVIFPVADAGVTKQECADWCMALGVKPPDMYLWSDHANCVGCRRGGKGYWLAVQENEPEVFAAMANIPENFPGRSGDMWTASIDIDAKRIVGYSWPEPFYFHMKVTDLGTYRLVAADNVWSALQHRKSRRQHYYGSRLNPGTAERDGAGWLELKGTT